MRNSKNLLFLLLGFIAFPLSVAIACDGAGTTSSSQPSFATYTNEDWGYAIGYPFYWQTKVVDSKETNLIPPAQYRGYVGIYVTDDTTLAVSTAAQRWLMAISSTWNNVSLLDERMMQGPWDWYLSYDYEADYGEEFHAETYFKKTATGLYKIDTVGEKWRYDSYPFNTIISTFQLLPE